MSVSAPPRIHPTAILEEGVGVGPGTSIWDNVHIRHSTTLGSDCIIGEKTHISYGVRIGDRCKINAFVYICTGVEIDSGVMVSAGATFTNDRYPRATTSDLTRLRSSDPDERTLQTRVREGATIGAGAVIGCGIEIGRFAMVGMGAVVTRSVPAFHLVVGSPARTIGVVCRCGDRIHSFGEGSSALAPSCNSCRRTYAITAQHVEELVS